VRYCLNLDAHILTVLLYIHAKLVKSWPCPIYYIPYSTLGTPRLLPGS
jgi:hypothetical protein